METHATRDELAEELRALRLEVAELRAAAPKFGLFWADRPEPLALQLDQCGVGLVLDETRTVGTPSSGAREHLLIEGDNLAGLRALRSSHQRAIDVIYIDPPYNTGNTNRTGFTYSDRFRTAEDEERHSSWLTMMRLRLSEARELMKPTGAILISIDDNEAHHLRVLCDQVFGEHNFIAQLVWDGGNVKNNARYISGTHEYVLVYARSLAALTDAGITWREPRPGTELLLARYEQLKAKHGTNYDRISAELKKWVKKAPLSARLKVFTGVDARGLYTYADLSAPGGKGSRYDVIHPTTGKPCQVPSRGWGCTQDRMTELLNDDRLLFGADEKAQVMRKLYLADKTDQVRRSILEYPARSSTHLIEHMLGKRNAFNNPKNLEMLSDLISLVAPKDAVVLDFFAGSGTTGHAVLSLNAKDEGTRQFILMTNNENNICDDVTYPRLVAAITGEWGNGRKETPLNGAMAFARTVVPDMPRPLGIEELGGLVFLESGMRPVVASHTASATGERSAFAWDGAGRRADAQRALTRFVGRLPEGAEVTFVGEATRTLALPVSSGAEAPVP